ncbi:MAG: ATP-binding protein [Magnetococcus sp. THC-1_WYH]
MSCYPTQRNRPFGHGGWLKGVVLSCVGMLFLFFIHPGWANSRNDGLVLDVGTVLKGLSATPFIAIMEDPGGMLDIDAIRSPVWESHFVPIEDGKANRGLQTSAWWVRLEVVNHSNQAVQWLLEATHPQTDFLDFYLFDDRGNYQTYLVGDMRPFGNRPVPFESFVIPVKTQPSEHCHVYIRFAFEKMGMVDTQIRLWSPKHFANHRDLIGLLQGAFFGGLAFMFVYNLFLFFATRMEEYLWYVLYLFFQVLTAATSLGLAHRYFYNDSEWLTDNLFMMSMPFTMIMAIQFSRKFLDMRKHMPRLDDFYLFWNLFALLSVVVLGLGQREWAIGMILVIPVPMLLLPFVSAWFWFKGEKRVRFYTLAWGMAGILLIFPLVHWMGFNEFSILNTWGNRIGIWLEAVFFSLALADTINILRQEKEMAQRREQALLIQTKEGLENKVLERTRDLEAAKLQADEASAAKSAFLATMSHEIRTPMNGILGMTHLALQTLLTVQQREYLEKIRLSTRYLLDIINNILDFSKLEAGKMAVERIVFSLNDVVESLSSLFSAKARSNQLEFQISVAQDVPEYVIGDPLRIKQVLANLVGNAIKFTEAGWVRLEISCDTLESQQVILRFLVEDTGIGMTISEQANLFREFSQADSSISRKYGGTGLGLSISQRLVAQMGGKIHVVSEPGCGSSFGFSLRLDLPQGERDTSDLPPGDLFAEEIPPEFFPAHVLLVEDNAINQQVARELLEGVGLKVTIANNGQEGIQAVQREPYDLVLMDVQMPLMDGFQATKWIRADGRFDHLPIIAMTAHVLFSDLEKCQNVGMSDHVGKPVEPAALYRTLGRWLPFLPGKPSFPQSSIVAPNVAGAGVLPQSIPGINLEQGLSKVRYNHLLFRKLLLEFYQDHGASSLRMREAIDQGRLDDAQHLAHTIKGAAGNLGAINLAKAAGYLETGLKSFTAIDKHWKIFQWSCDELMDGLARIHTVLIEESTAVKDRATDRESLFPLVKELAASLREASPQSMDVLERMEPVVGMEHQERFETLRNEINGFQFEEAMVTLEKLTQESGVYG